MSKAAKRIKEHMDRIKQERAAEWERLQKECPHCDCYHLGWSCCDCGAGTEQTEPYDWDEVDFLGLGGMTSELIH